MMASEAWKITKNAPGKYVYLKLAFTLSTIVKKE
jgi:hypothetical protein